VAEGRETDDACSGHSAVLRTGAKGREDIIYVFSKLDVRKGNSGKK